MRNFNKLDPISLKAFYFAAQTLNFTQAAQFAALTQSGVSQHIGKLEKELGLNLFLRVQKRVQLTEAGLELQKFVEEYLDSIDGLTERLQRQKSDLQGKVRYAMPDSCLFTPHFQLLLDERKKSFPKIDIKVQICSSERVVQLLKNSEIDFGFVTKALEDREIELKEFVKEEYVLASHHRMTRISTLAALKSQEFINYPGMEDLFWQWQQAEFPRSAPLRISELVIKGEINSIRGATTLAKNGIGLGVFQRHCIEHELQAKELFAYPATNAKKLENPIYIVTLKEGKLPARAQAVLSTFWKMKN